MKHAMEPKYDQSRRYTEPLLLRRISWGAVFVGLTAAVITQLLLTLLGVGIGAATINPLQERVPGDGLAIGAAIWFFVSSIIAMYIGGHVAGRFCNAPARKDGMNHGLLTWAATTILSGVFFATMMTSLVGAAAGTAAAGTAIQANSSDVSSSSPISVNEPKARQAGELAAKSVSQTALATFFLLLLTGTAAAIGGRNSVRRSGPEEHVVEESEVHAPAFARP